MGPSAGCNAGRLKRLRFRLCRGRGLAQAPRTTLPGVPEVRVLGSRAGAANPVARQLRGVHPGWEVKPKGFCWVGDVTLCEGKSVDAKTTDAAAESSRREDSRFSVPPPLAPAPPALPDVDVGEAGACPFAQVTSSSRKGRGEPRSGR